MISALLALPLLVAPAPPAAPLIAPPVAPAVAPSLAPLAPASAPAQAEDDPQSGDPPPIQEQGDFYIVNFSEDQSQAMELAQFVKLCSQATGRNFIITEETKTQLADKPVRMFGTKTIRKKDFYRFFQIVMFIYEFACVEVGPSYMSVTVIQSLAAGRGSNVSNIKQKAVNVLPEDLDNYLDQPAVLITTVVTLPHTDVRQLTTSLRALLTDNQTQNMLNAGNSNSVVLTGFGSNVASLAKLLFIVDEASVLEEEPPPLFEIVPLEFASAEEVADLVDQLLEALNKAKSGQPGRAEAQGPGGALRGRQPESKILVDRRQNALIVMATEDDMPRIKDLVAQLDVEVIEPERNFHIYNLENVKADEVAEVLEDFLQDAQRIADASGAGGARPPGQSSGSSSSSQNEVVVVPDPTTNSLLIAASKTRYQEVLEMIRQLDRRQDQVLIETALIELTGSNLLDIGVELGIADIPGTGTGGFGVTDFGLGTITFDAAGNPLAKIPNQMSGVTAGIIQAGEFNLPVLVRAVEETNNANVLNVPSVLVNNNKGATVIILSETPVTQITATGGVGGQTQENFSEYVDAGVELHISPTITAARYLSLAITLKISNFTAPPQGSIPPPKITREITTTINVPDGDTMVIGGIVSDTSRAADEQVPWLGDLPILGNLFKRQTDQTERTTLYFFVTPHILHDRDFADLAEISYRTKLNAAETIGYGRMQMIDPNFGKSGMNEIDFEAFEVPLYDSPERGEVSSDDIGLDPVRRAELEGDAMRAAAAKDPLLEGTHPANQPASESAPRDFNAPLQTIAPSPLNPITPAPKTDAAEQAGDDSGDEPGDESGNEPGDAAGDQPLGS